MIYSTVYFADFRRSFEVKMSKVTSNEFREC